MRHQFGQLVDLPQRHFQNTANIAHHPTRQKRAERDDLRDAIHAIPLANIGDDFVTAILAEVDIEIRHRNTFRIQKPLEQQIEAQRIQIGDGQRIGDQRPCTRAAPRPHRNALRFGPFDKIGNDEEISGELHIDDNVQLKRQPCGVIRFREIGCQTVLAHPRNEARFRLCAQGGNFVERCSVHRGKARQDRLACVRPNRTAAGNFDGVVERLGNIGKQLAHLVTGFKAVMRG